MQWLYTGGLAIVIYVALRMLARPRPEASASFGGLRQIAMIAGYASFFLSALLVANFARVMSIPGLLIEELSFLDWLTLFSPMIIVPMFLAGIVAAIIVRRDLLLFLLGACSLVLALLPETGTVAASLTVKVARLYVTFATAAPLAMLAWWFFGPGGEDHHARPTGNQE